MNIQLISQKAKGNNLLSNKEDYREQNSITQTGQRALNSLEYRHSITVNRIHVSQLTPSINNYFIDYRIPFRMVNLIVNQFNEFLKTIPQGLKNGKSQIKTPEGSYYGPIIEGLPMGKGIMEVPLAKYVGIFNRKGLPDGEGVLLAYDRTIEGTFQEGFPQKEGKASFVVLEELESKVINGILDVRNLKTLSQNHKYQGSFKNGVRHGVGKYFWPDGDIYEGEFTEGDLTGKGKLIFVDGDIYEGFLRNGAFHGMGSYILSDGTKYVGNWEDGELNGKGVCYYSQGRKYEGDFLKTKRHGKGIFTLSNGCTYESTWVNDQPTGLGACKTLEGNVVEIIRNQGKMELKKC